MIALLLASTAATLPTLGHEVQARIRDAADSSDWHSTEPQLVRVALFADPAGTVIDCEVRAVAMSQRNADAMCRVAKTRQVQPAASSRGKPAFGLLVYHYLVWDPRQRMTRSLQLPSDPELVLQINTYPAGHDKPFPVGLIIEVEADGTISSCIPHPAEQESLSGLACEEAVATNMPIRRDAEGAAVPYIAPFSVEFTIE